MKFAFRRPCLPCVGIAGGNAYAITKVNDFARVIKTDPTKVAHFYDGRGTRYEYLPDLNMVVPKFPRSVFRKKHIVDTVFGCSNMMDVDARIKTKNLSNTRLDELILELCVAIAGGSLTRK
jgi:hypothetical protein